MTMNKLILSFLTLLFTMTAGAADDSFTYWTAQGEVLPLPVGEDHRLTVPAEAVAVDLRGLQDVDVVD